MHGNFYGVEIIASFQFHLKSEVGRERQEEKGDDGKLTELLV